LKKPALFFCAGVFLRGDFLCGGFFRGGFCAQAGGRTHGACLRPCGLFVVYFAGAAETEPARAHRELRAVDRHLAPAPLAGGARRLLRVVADAVLLPQLRGGLGERAAARGESFEIVQRPHDLV
jgi:hypothetical protein